MRTFDDIAFLVQLIDAAQTALRRFLAKRHTVAQAKPRITATTYRSGPAPLIPVAPPVRRGRRLLCWMIGHRWTVYATSPRAGYMAHLHPLAGCLADCTRCGTRWDDLPAGWEQMVPERHEETQEQRWNEHTARMERL